MKIRKILSIGAALGMAVSLMAGNNYDFEIKANEMTLEEEISNLNIEPVYGGVEFIPEGWDDDFNYLPPTLLLHGNAVIFTSLGAVDDGWTRIYLDVNENGKLDKGTDKEINLGSYSDTGISGAMGSGYDLSETVVYVIGDLDGTYSTHEGDLLVTVDKGATLMGIIGSTDLCDQNGKYILKTLADNGEIGIIEGAGAGTWTGDITMSLAGEMPMNEVYGGSKEAETTIYGNVKVIDNDANSTGGVFGNNVWGPNSGGLYAGGNGTTINGDFEVLIKRSGSPYTFYDVDASQATITGNVNYSLASSELYGTLKTNEAAARDSKTSIKIGSFSTENNGSIYLYEGEKVVYYDKKYYYATSLAIEPEIKEIGTVVVEAQNDVAFTNSTAYTGIKLNRNTGYVVNSENTYQIVIGRASEDVKEITFDTGTEQDLEPLLELKGDSIKLPVISRSDYEFAGWSDGVNTYAPGSDYIIPDGDVKLTAVWKSNSSSSSSSSSSKPSNGFIKKKGETYFYEKGKPVEDGFIILNEKDKLVDTVASGKLTELNKSDYKAYYAKPDGTIAKVEWIIIDSKGKFVETLPIGEFKKQYGKDYKVYLADENGKLVKSWKDTEGNWYYFNSDFSAKYEYWQAHYSDWYYFENYSYIKNTWHATDNGRWYYFDDEGKMIRNQWIDGCWINELGIYWSPIYSDSEFIANYKE